MKRKKAVTGPTKKTGRRLRACVLSTLMAMAGRALFLACNSQFADLHAPQETVVVPGIEKKDQT